MVDKIYNVGDKVWEADCGTKEIKYPCPVCYGKKEVVLILGNDDRVILQCDFCKRGLGQPSGEITQYEYIAEPKEITITGVSIEQGCKGEKRKYHVRNSSFCAEDIFGTMEQATTRCAEKVAEKADENLKQRDVKNKVSKTYSWNAGYHMRAIAGAQRELEYHTRMAKICNDRSRDKVKA